MPLSKIDLMYVTHTSKRICQGDILRDIDAIDWDVEYKITKITLPYAIVMTQDCDLEWDSTTGRNQPLKNMINIYKTFWYALLTMQKHSRKVIT